MPEDAPSIAQQRIKALERDVALLEKELRTVTANWNKARHDLKRCESDLAAQRRRDLPNA